MNETNSCYNLRGFEYGGLLETIGVNWRNELKERLTDALFDDELLRGKQYCFITPGSDGKKERHPQSKTELILLLRQKDPQLVGEVEQRMETIRREGFVLGPVETKIVGKEESSLSFFNDLPQRVYPDRVLNSYLLMGDSRLYLEARRQILEEMKGGKVRKKMRNQLKQYRKAIETGEYRGLEVFSEEKGEQYYFENSDTKQIRFGFKIAFLRAVQRKLDLLTVGLIEEGDKNINMLAKSLPANTTERIDYLVKRGLLDQGFASRLQIAYLWFLKNYHKAQETFSKNKHQRAVVPFDKNRFATEKEVIMEFVSPNHV